MKIKFIEHAKERMRERGASEEDVKKVLSLGIEMSARKGRKAKEMIFTYKEEWLGRIYPQKKIVVIYTEEKGETVVITVKVFYGEWR